MVSTRRILSSRQEYRKGAWALRDLEQGRTRCPRWGAVAALAAALGLDECQQAELASAWSGGHRVEAC